MVRYIDENYEDEGLTVSEPLRERPMAYLTLLVDGRPSHSVPLRDTVKVGRDKRNVVVTADQKVSRHHATLTLTDDSFILQDEGSANGTYVNDVLIAQPTRLKDNDKLRFGDTIFLYTHSEPIPEAVYNTPAIPNPVTMVQRGTDTAATSSIPPWTIIGCLALIIIALLFIIAVLLGIFVGQGQVAMIFSFLNG